MKKIISCLSFMVLAIFMICCLMRILCVKSDSGIGQARNLYVQPENKVDVLFLGSSHVHCNVDTRILWEQEGIAAYFCTSAEQPLWNTYHYLIEALKTQTPELVVIDVFGPARFHEDEQEVYLAENLEGMRFSLNKYKAVQASTDSEHLSWMLGYPRYHDRYDDLSKADFQNFWWDQKEQSRWKGYVELYSHAALTEPDISGVTQKAPMTEKSQIYFGRIIDLCKEEKIPLVLITAPYLVEESDQMIYNEIEYQAKVHGIIFKNFNLPEIYREMEIDFAADFADHAHLNTQGAQKYSRLLASWLKQNFEISDRRGEEGYESWESQSVLHRGNKTLQ